ncbi:hypothetical protein IQ272_16125 [Chroococcidiopsidales cyanobacterium LEGE 13417]|nr:hypothetical protein [Chroococcidiopsidales cyanobacterium LEGE 13417]
MRLTIIKDSDSTGIGRIEAQIGMKLTNGYEVTKVNSKSLIGRDSEGWIEEFSYPISIYYTEAKRWGIGNLGIDDSTEKRAATERKFRRGEFLYQLYMEHGSVLPLNDPAERAGYEFAERIQVMRSTEIQQLIERERGRVAR